MGFSNENVHIGMLYAAKAAETSTILFGDPEDRTTLPYHVVRLDDIRAFIKDLASRVQRNDLGDIPPQLYSLVKQIPRSQSLSPEQGPAHSLLKKNTITSFVDRAANLLYDQPFVEGSKCLDDELAIVLNINGTNECFVTELAGDDVSLAPFFACLAYTRDFYVASPDPFFREGRAKNKAFDHLPIYTQGGDIGYAKYVSHLSDFLQARTLPSTNEADTFFWNIPGFVDYRREKKIPQEEWLEEFIFLHTRHSSNLHITSLQENRTSTIYFSQVQKNTSGDSVHAVVMDDDGVHSLGALLSLCDPLSTFYSEQDLFSMVLSDRNADLEQASAFAAYLLQLDPPIDVSSGVIRYGVERMKKSHLAAECVSSRIKHFSGGAYSLTEEDAFSEISGELLAAPEFAINSFFLAKARYKGQEASAFLRNISLAAVAAKRSLVQATHRERWSHMKKFIFSNEADDSHLRWITDVYATTLDDRGPWRRMDNYGFKISQLNGMRKFGSVEVDIVSLESLFYSFFPDNDGSGNLQLAKNLYRCCPDFAHTFDIVVVDAIYNSLNFFSEESFAGFKRMWNGPWTSNSRSSSAISMMQSDLLDSLSDWYRPYCHVANFLGTDLDAIISEVKPFFDSKDPERKVQWYYRSNEQKEDFGVDAYVKEKLDIRD